ncbi:hypothetical protein [[Enterobacter] lignolyticus]|uniref:Uncharacterized protein n=1 Tax=Enterobacter lignolyticus (strain SCF1) TaxID=701347 RepID=E3G4T0_ENTLS|nr:hypothetical protein [[Enterobacter] lignolyticus]ADO50548.1 hypothetical protein Entcl_4317 [[Enterobacter] lignolyticus SCF1]
MPVNANVITEIIRERERLTNAPSLSDEPTGIGTVRFVVSCESNAENILSLAKNVLKTVDDAYDSDWPDLASWKKILPKIFVDNCEPEISKRDMDHRIAYRKSLPWEEQQRLMINERWSLDNWLYWLEPENRTWFWWDAVLLEEPIRDTHFIVAVVVLEWPFPWGALKWLFKACGALDVVSEDDL